MAGTSAGRLEDGMNAAWKFVCLIAVAAAVAAPSAAQEKIKEGAVKTKDAVVKGATVVGSKTKEGAVKTGEAVTDAWITTHVNERFVSEDLLKGSAINVDTEKHVVTLKGTVLSAAGRTRATSIARRTKGVHRVINLLTIGPKKA
jgi:osmotically-inducible protein OsmY